MWKNFNQFFIKLDQKPSTWEDRLNLYVGYLINCNKHASTVKSYILAIKSVLWEVNVELNEDKVLLSSLTRACRLVNTSQVISRIPIRKSILRQIIKVADQHFQTQPYLNVLYKSLFITAYYGLFRVGEITADAHPVKACDVQIGQNKNKIMFTLRSSKTHLPHNLPQQIKLVSQPCKMVTPVKNPICPFTAIKAFLQFRGPACDREEQFFVFSDHSPVYRDKVTFTKKRGR